MGKSLFITEKPSVAREFASALSIKGGTKDGYIEDDKFIITWCVGHLIAMSYPEAYDEELKKWTLETLPFLPKPDNYKYEVISSVKKQYGIVKSLLNRSDVDKIYYSGDSAREGEYIQRLVRAKAGHNKSASEYRVWINSQTKDEIIKGIKEAKPLSEYDSLSDSAYARAIEDYGIGINFSRAVSLKYANKVFAAAGEKRGPIAIGRVMSFVLGMIVDRERAIRNNIKTVYYTVSGTANDIESQWQASKNSKLYKEVDLYKDIGFLRKEQAESFIKSIQPNLTYKGLTTNIEKKSAPKLFNLAELQGECTKLYHISPDQTLDIAQKLYEAKLTTYPRTDARVLTTAVAKVITTNIRGLQNVQEVSNFATDVLNNNMYTGLAKSKYVNDADVSDHYAIIPTGDVSSLKNISGLERDVYILIARRFLSIFYPSAEYEKAVAKFVTSDETFFTKVSLLVKPGWLEVADKIPQDKGEKQLLDKLKKMAENSSYSAEYNIKETETAPPKRYTTGGIVLALENAGNLIEEEELREQIKSSGIGTSATRAETIKKLESIKYISVNKKQIVTPTALGEIIYEVLDLTLPLTLNAKMTASWEKGLSQIAEKQVTKDVYLDKMYKFIKDNTENIKKSDYNSELDKRIDVLSKVYKGVSLKNHATGAYAVTEYKCPKCGQKLAVFPSGTYGCTDKDKCGYFLANKWAKKSLSDAHMRKLLEGETTSEIKGFTSTKSGKKFSCKLRLNSEGRIEPVFDNKKS